MKMNKVNHSYQSYSCADGVASINIYNGNLLFEYPLVSTGMNSFEISTSLVYNSDYQSNDFNGRLIGMGNGWKLNIEQHVFKYESSFNLEGFTEDDYVYIDSNWNIHKFIKYYPNDDTTYPMHYYDESGKGLRLSVDSDKTMKIIDSLKNTYIFNTVGRLTKIISSINENICKRILYLGEKIFTIYDERKENRKITFEYDGNFIKKTFGVQQNTSYLFNYNNGKLFEISKQAVETVDEVEKTYSKKLMTFLYNENNLINYFISNSDLLGIKCDYTENKLTTISSGAIVSSLETEETETELYLEADSQYNIKYFDNTKANESDYLTNVGYKYKNIIYSMPSEYVNNKNIFEYFEQYTQVINNSGIKYRYYFDTKEKVISNFETDDNGNLYSLFRNKGWKLSNDSENYELKLNNEKCNLVNENYSYVIPTTLLTEFNKIFDEDLNDDTINDNKYTEHFKVSFWLNFLEDHGSSINIIPFIEFQLEGEEEIKRFKSRIEFVKENVWQYVVIPINLGETPKKISNLKIGFLEDERSSKKLVSNVYIEKGSTNDIMFSYNDTSEYKLEFDDLIIDNDGYNTISQQFYFTENDLFETYKNIYLKNENEMFDMVYNNGTKVKKVSYIYLYKDSKQIFFNLNSDGLANYFTKSIDKSAYYYIREGERLENNIWIIYEKHVIFYKELTGDHCYKIKNAIGTVDENSNYILSDDKAIISYNTIKLNGTIFSIKDTRNIIQNYYDDGCGNIMIKEMYQKNWEDDSYIEDKYNYDVFNCFNDDFEYTDETLNNMYKNEFLINYRYGNKKVSYDYDEKSGLVKNVCYSYTQVDEDENEIENVDYYEEYCYDKYNEQIKNIIIKDKDNNILSNNQIEYMNNGLIKKIKNLDNETEKFNYYYMYDKYANIHAIDINKTNKIVYNKEKENDVETITQDIQYLDEENKHVKDLTKQIKNIYDKHGRIKEVNNNSENTKFYYEDETDEYQGPISLARISQIEDGFSGEVRNYVYVDNGDVTSKKEEIKDKFEYTESSNNKIEYSILDEDEIVVYLETPIDSLNNMIQTTNYYIKERGRIYEDPCVEFSYTYDYDGCNRFSKKTSKEIVYEKCNGEAPCTFGSEHPEDIPGTTGYTLIKEIGYDEDTYLPKGIYYTRHYTKVHTYANSGDYVPNRYIKWSYIFNHDNYNNISEIKEYKENNELIVHQYEYDAKKQLKKEIILYKEENSTGYELKRQEEYLFEYFNETGLLYKVTKTTTDLINNTTTSEIKLIKDLNDNLTNEIDYDKLYTISYDKYGNVISDGKSTMTYNSRNQLESYRFSTNEGETINHIYNYYYNYQGVRYKKEKNINQTISYVNYYLNGSKILGEDWTNENGDIEHRLKYFYDLEGICGIRYNGYNISLVKDALGNVSRVMYDGNLIGQYSYDAWGNCTVEQNYNYVSNISDENLKNAIIFILNNNPFRYRGYYYDVETNLALVSSRYYSPELGRFIQPADVSSLNPQSINGLNLYTYANNNPISFSYNNSSAVGSTNVAGGLVSSIGTGNSFVGNVNSGSPSKGGLNLGWLKNGLDTGSTIHGLYTSISGLVNHTAYFAKNLTPFADDMTMLGASMKDGVLAFNQFSWGLGKSDIFGIALGVGLDIYDSIQRGVSPGGVVLGATLTAAKGVGLIYLNKGILYGATALGSAICPGVGTVVGFVVGGIVCIVVDIFASNWLDDLIDKIAK